jgi:hypothetical protein
MIYLLGATVLLLCGLEVLAILFWWQSMKRVAKLDRGWETVNRDLDDAEEKRRKGMQ